MRKFLLGELRFYSRLIILTGLFILVVHYAIVPGIVAGLRAQQQAVVSTVTHAPQNLLDKIKELAP